MKVCSIHSTWEKKIRRYHLSNVNSAVKCQVTSAIIWKSLAQPKSFPFPEGQQECQSPQLYFVSASSLSLWQDQLSLLSSLQEKVERKKPTVNTVLCILQWSFSWQIISNSHHSFGGSKCLEPQFDKPCRNKYRESRKRLPKELTHKYIYIYIYIKEKK